MEQHRVCVLGGGRSALRSRASRGPSGQTRGVRRRSAAVGAPRGTRPRDQHRAHQRAVPRRCGFRSEPRRDGRRGRGRRRDARRRRGAARVLEATLRPAVAAAVRPDAVVLVSSSLHVEPSANLSLASSQIAPLLGLADDDRLCVLMGPNLYKQMLDDDGFAEATIGYDDDGSGRGRAGAALAARALAAPCPHAPVAGARPWRAAARSKHRRAGVGMCDGAGHGANCQTALIRAGLGEMRRFATRSRRKFAHAHVFTDEACARRPRLTCTAGRGRQLASGFGARARTRGRRGHVGGAVGGVGARDVQRDEAARPAHGQAGARRADGERRGRGVSSSARSARSRSTARAPPVDALRAVMRPAKAPVAAAAAAAAHRERSDGDDSTARARRLWRPSRS